MAAAWTTALAAVTLQACGRGDGPAPVVIYVSADEVFARPLLDEFERETGIPVRAKFDTEATKTTALASLLRQERQRPRADVFWSSEVFVTAQLAEEGVLAPNDDPTLADWPVEFRDPKRRWYGFAARARVIVFSPRRVDPQEAPSTWTDLARERWKGRVVMADPRFGTTRGHVGAMSAWWSARVDPSYFGAWVEGLAENEVRLLTSGNAGVVEAVISGEADVGMTDTDDVWVAKARGAEIELVYPRHVRDRSEIGAGTLLIPNTVGLVAGGPNPEGGKRLMAWLLSPRVEEALLRSESRNVPLRPERLSKEAAELAAGLAVPDPLRVDYGRVAERMDAAVDQLMEALRPRATVPPRGE